MKKYFCRFKQEMMYIIGIIVLNFLFTLLEFIGINYQLCSISINTINFILIFVYALSKGKKTNIIGYKSGIKSGIKIIFILSTINLITLSGFSFKTIFYYLLIIVITMFGGIIGKNKKNNPK